MTSPLTAIIFDLDNCLSPAKEVGEDVADPAFQAIRQANNGLLDEETLARALVDCWRHPIDWIAKTYGFSDAMVQAAWQEFSRMQVTKPMYGYGDLNVLHEFPVQRFLVTSGFRCLQNSKLKALAIEDVFTQIYIDAVDESDRLGKQGLFSLIMREHNLAADEILVVGDNSESEIAAGNALGITTVQILRPEVPQGSTATFYVEDLRELHALYLSLVNENKVVNE